MCDVKNRYSQNILLFYSTRDSPQYFDLSRGRIARFMNRVLALSMMMPKHTYLACATHTESDIQYTEIQYTERKPLLSVYIRAPSIQHPCLLLIVTLACRRIINCIVAGILDASRWTSVCRWICLSETVIKLSSQLLRSLIFRVQDLLLVN